MLTTINETRESSTSPANSYLKGDSIQNSNPVVDEVTAGAAPTMSYAPEMSLPLYSTLNSTFSGSKSVKREITIPVSG